MADGRDPHTQEPAQAAPADRSVDEKKADSSTRVPDDANDEAQPNHLGEAEAEFERSRGSR